MAVQSRKKKIMKLKFILSVVLEGVLCSSSIDAYTERNNGLYS
jgi:hypothetical protein